MVKKAQDVVLTPGRGPIALNNVINQIGGKVTAKEVKSKSENLKIRTGKVVRFYPQTDKVSVKLDDTGKIVRCVMLHNLAVSGEATISFTPSGSISTDVENDNEYSIIPFNEHIVAVLNIKDSLNKSEYLCLGFISRDSSLIKSNGEVGEYLVSNDNSKVSVKQSQVNIESENLYLNGNRIQATDELSKIFATKEDVVCTVKSLVSDSAITTPPSTPAADEEVQVNTSSQVDTEIEALKERLSEIENTTTSEKSEISFNSNISNNEEILTGKVLIIILKNAVTNELAVDENVSVILTRFSDNQSKTYAGTTDSLGNYSLPLNLSAGAYTYQIIYNGSNIYKAKTGEVVKFMIGAGSDDGKKSICFESNIKDNESITKGSIITCKFTDCTNGVALTGLTGKYILTRLSDNQSKTYAETTDNLGNMIITINLSKGDYSIQASYDGDEIYSKKTGEVIKFKVGIKE